MNLKILSLLLAASLSLAAVLAVTATAEEEAFEFHSDGSPTTFTGAALGGATFTVDAGEGKCASVTFHGEMSSSTANEIELEPTTKECTWALGTVVYDWNGCRHRFLPDKDTNAFQFDTTDYLKCPAGKELTVTAFASGVLKCTWHYPPQDVGTSEWTNNGFGNVQAILKYSKLKYSQTAGTGFGACPNALNTTNGEFTEEVEIEAKNSGGEATEFWHE